MTNSELNKKDLRKNFYNIDGLAFFYEWTVEENGANSDSDASNVDILAKVGEHVSGASPMGDLEVPSITYNDVGGGDDINEYEDHEHEDDYFDFNMNDFLG